MIKKQLQRNRTVLIRVCVLACLMGASACTKDQSQPSAPAPVNPALSAKVQTQPVQKPVSSVVRLPPAPVNKFDFSTKKDPFKPFVVVKAVPNRSPEALRKAQHNALPIHSFDVNQFKLIGIITGSRGSQAMVTDPGGKGYVLKVGMSIGKNAGKVTSITARGVDVLEQFRDDNGRVRKEHINLSLPRKQ